jgi:hypothetical protein
VSITHYQALGLVDKNFPWDKNTDEITCGQVDENYKNSFKSAENHDEKNILNIAKDAIYEEKQCNLFYDYQKLGFVNEFNQWSKNYHEITCEDIDENYKKLYEEAHTNPQKSQKRKLNEARRHLHSIKACENNPDLPLI